MLRLKLDRNDSEWVVIAMLALTRDPVSGSDGVGATDASLNSLF